MYFSFAMTRWKLSPSTRFEISHLQHVNCTSKNPISPKEFNRFSKTFLHLKRCESGHLDRKFQVRWYFTFAMARWKLSQSTRFEITDMQPVNCPSKDPISPKAFNRFSKTVLHLKRVESGNLGRQFQARSYFTFAMTRWGLRASTSFEIFHFQHVNCPSKNPISPKVLTRFTKNLLHLERVESGHFAENFRCACFLVLQWQGENLAHQKGLKFPTFNL